MPKNRDKYILKRNEYDLLIAIEENTGICPILAVSGISQDEQIERCYKHIKSSCKGCVQEWLNEGE